MNATDTIAALRSETRRLQQSLQHTASNTAAFQLLGQQLQQKLTALHEAQQSIFSYGNDLTR